MQLKILILVVFGIASTTTYAQNVDSTATKLEPIEINFLSNYYQQDGSHSPVGGGIGSEKLSNITDQIMINIPVKRNITINLKTGIEFFTSASQNGNNNSSANYSDDRRDHDDDDDDDEYYSGASPQKRPPRSIITYGEAGLAKENEKKNLGFNGSIGFYRDNNATSGTLATGFTKSSANNNNTFNAAFTYSLDQWNLTDHGVVINGAEHLGNGRRQSYSASLSYSRIFTKRFTAAIVSDLIYQNGLLSTPYHNVYFANTDTIPAIERLPNTRIKFPVGLRLNYHATDWLILRSYYRYYNDTWGIHAHTFSIETPLKINQWLRFYPFYRFHTQTATNYFSAFNTLLSNEQQFYTADYDLSDLQTHKMGIGISVAPANGLFKSRDRHENGRNIMMSSLDFRYAYYTRNDGLNGHMFTAGLNFEIARKD